MAVLVVGASLSGIDPAAWQLVFLLAPVMRTIARIETPSTIIPRIWARLSVGELVHAWKVREKTKVSSIRVSL